MDCSYESFDVSPNITIKIKPWDCSFCKFHNISHPYYCLYCESINSIYSVVSENYEFKSSNKIDKIRRVFGKTSKILIPIVSSITRIRLMQNLEKLYPYWKCGKISGVFINSTIHDEDFEISYRDVRLKFPDMWIGVNILGGCIIEVLNFIHKYKPDGICMDNAYLIDEKNLGVCEMIINQFKHLKWDGLYFGGVMFKYQSSCNIYNEKVLKFAYQYMDVLTTTGDKTGIPIKKEKLNFIHLHSKNICIGLASGITPSNIKDFADKANIFFFRSGITDFEDDVKTNVLDQILKNFK